jgi:UPF0755 protein
MLNNIFEEITHYIIKFVVLVIAVVVIYRAALWAYDSGYQLMAREPLENRAIMNMSIEIPQGANTEVIGKILEDKGLINSSVYFRILARIKGIDNQFQYGDYDLNTGMKEEEIMKILTTQGEKREVVKFTIPEGYTIEKIIDKLVSLELCTEAEFMNAMENGRYGYKFMQYIPDRNLRLQGYLFPATYEVYADATAEDIISTMLEKFDQVFKDEYYDQMEKMGMTLDEIVTIASIIEREVRVPEERALVSRVIYNRLDIDMPLQMCSTIMYVLDVPRSRVLYRDLEIQSPYNTYINSGLPVGPIANPGEASIIASLYPEDNNYLYFVLADTATGAHHFSVTLDEHNRAKQKYNQEF